MFIQLLVAALLTGSIYGLIALGYSLIYRASGIMTLSQSDPMCLGGFLGYAFYTLLGLLILLDALCTVIGALIIGCLLENFVIRPIFRRRVSTSSLILATVAISYILQSVELVIWGGTPLSLNSFLSIETITVGGVIYQTESLMCIAVAVICMIVLHLFMKKTSFGIAMRAAAMDQDAARSCGINVDSTTRITWAISTGVAGLAGMLIGPLYGVTTTLGTSMSAKGFASAVIGGYGDMYGALIGGGVLSFLETFVAGYISSSLREMIAYIAVLIVLFIRPRGILNVEAVQD